MLRSFFRILGFNPVTDFLFLFHLLMISVLVKTCLPLLHFRKQQNPNTKLKKTAILLHFSTDDSIFLLCQTKQVTHCTGTFSKMHEFVQNRSAGL